MKNLCVGLLATLSMSAFAGKTVCTATCYNGNLSSANKQYEVTRPLIGIGVDYDAAMEDLRLNCNDTQLLVPSPQSAILGSAFYFVNGKLIKALEGKRSQYSCIEI